MNTIERPEGFKEKRAELTVQRIHPLGAGTISSPPSIPIASSQKTVPSYESPLPTPTPAINNIGVIPQDEPASTTPKSTNYERTTYPAIKKKNQMGTTFHSKVELGVKIQLLITYNLSPESYERNDPRRSQSAS